MRKSMLLIFNPTAGLGTFVQNLYEVVDKFTKHGFLVTAYPTQGPRDAFRVAKEWGGRYDYLVCSGGDGTLNEVVDGLMQAERKPVCGYIPSGTTNDFAHSIGLPVDALHAAEVVCSGVPMAIDIGRFQSEFFSYVAAFGLFTDVPYETPQSMKNALGHAAYMLEGVKRLANIKSWHCRVECDGEVIEDDFVFGMVANSMSIGGFKLPMEHGVQGDGLFEVILLRRIKRFAHLQDVVGVITGANAESNLFVVRSARSIAITCDEDLSWTLDGEFGGTFREVRIQVEKHAMRIMAPAPQDEEEQAKS